MRRVRWLLMRLLGHLTRGRLDRELDEEIRMHVALAIEDNVRAGMPPVEARAAALRTIGGVEQTKEISRDQQRVRAIETTMRDVRHAMRLWRTQPGFSAIVVLAIALGVGANTAVFAVLHAVVWRPLPYPEPQHLVRLFQTRQQETRGPVSPLNYLDWRDRATSLEAIAAYREWRYELAGSEGKETIPGARVSASIFDVLRVAPIVGRPFSADEDTPAGAPVAIVSHRFWQTRYAADAAIIGRTLTLGDTTFTIVGVLPAGIDFPSRDAAIWTPLRIGDSTHRRKRTENYLQVIARVDAGLPAARVRDDLDRVAAQLAAEDPVSSAGVRIASVTLDEIVTGRVRAPLLLLFGAVSCVLLMSAANVAHLLLARATTRRQELTLRAALGAGPGRLARQSLTETLLLALAGGAIGVFGAIAILDVLRPLLPATLPRREDIAIDAVTAAFALAATLAVGLACGLAPALAAWRTNLDDSLEGTRAASISSIAAARHGTLIVLQVSVSLVLSIGALLLLRSFQNVLGVDAGFSGDRLITMSVSLPGSLTTRAGQFQPAAVANRFEAIVEGVRRIPGVEAAGLVNHVPLTDDGSGTRFTIEHRLLPRPEDVPTASYRVVSPDYFATIGARLVAGRGFTAADRADGTPVYVVNAMMARRLWPDASPVGARIRRGGVTSTGLYATIVGVVADMKQQRLDVDASPEIYIPHAQFAWPEMHLVVRTSRALADVAPELRRALREVSASIAVQQPRTFEEVRWGTIRERQFATTLLTVFAVAALALATLGVYGVTSYATARRTKEVAIRVALGAHPAEVVRAVVGRTIRLIGIALVLGIGGGYLMAGLLSGTLFGVTIFDGVTYATAAVTVIGGALLATWSPVRRALRVDPVLALKAD